MTIALKATKKKATNSKKYHSSNWQLYSGFGITTEGRMEGMKKRQSLNVCSTKLTVHRTNSVILTPGWPERVSQEERSSRKASAR